MGLEPILYELMRLVSLPLNYLGIQHHYIWSVSNPPSTLCKSCFTCKLIRSCCVVYTTKHPWCVRSFTTVYKCRMVTRGGIEPTVLAVKERCLNHLTNGPCVTPILTRNPYVEESVGFEPTEHFCSTVFKTVALIQTLPTLRVTAQLRAVHCKP